MRRPLAYAALVALFGSAPPAVAQELLPDHEPPIEEEMVAPDKEALPQPADDVPMVSGPEMTRLDELFASLKKTPDARLAKPIADGIWAEWFRSGSASIDLMMHWSNEAIEEQKFNVALDFLDQVVTRKPDFAEGWNRRATLHYNMKNYAKSMADIHRVLSLEPRHFGAWSGMAIILEQTDKQESALKAWQKVLELYPAMTRGQEAVIRLSEQVEGDPA